MKIMTAMYTLRKGGAYDRFIMMLEALLERQCEVHCLSLTPVPIRDPLYHNHTPGIPYSAGNGILAKLMVLFLFPLFALWIGCRERVDLFVAFSSLYAFVQALPKLVLGKPMVTLIRGSFGHGLKVRGLFRNLSWLSRIIEYFGLIASDRILAVNGGIKSEIMGALGNARKIDVEVLHNNILVPGPFHSDDRANIRNRYGIPSDAKVLVTAGVLNRGKNIESLLKSLPKVETRNVFLLIIGEGSTKEDLAYVDSLKTMTRELAFGRRVIFTGWLEKEELWRMLRASDLFVLPSLNEGMPNVMLEAIGSDLPCLGSRIPGIEDILQYEELMFDPLDEGAIAGKIQRVLSDSQFFQKAKELCQERKKVFLFDWKEKVFEMVTRKLLHGTEA